MWLLITFLSAILHWFIARVRTVHHWCSRLICEIAHKVVGVVHCVVIIIIICVWVTKFINALVCLLSILLQQAITHTSISPARFLFPLQLIHLSSSWLNLGGDCFLLALNFLYNSSYFFSLKGLSTSSSIIMNPIVLGECIKCSLWNAAKTYLLAALFWQTEYHFMFILAYR